MRLTHMYTSVWLRVYPLMLAPSSLTSKKMEVVQDFSSAISVMVDKPRFESSYDN